MQRAGGRASTLSGQHQVRNEKSIMFRKNLLQRIERLERQLKPPALPGWEEFGPSSQTGARPEIGRRASAVEMVQRLNEGRKRMNQENALALQTAATKKAEEGSETTET